MTPTNLSGVLDQIEARADHDAAPVPLTLGDLLEAFGHRSYGPLLLVIGLFAISPITVIPGLTWVAAGLTFIVAGQMALGRKYIWLPRRTLGVELPRSAVKKGVAASRQWARRIDAILKPRLLFMSQPPLANVVALFCIGAALITFPLSYIPLAPLAPSLAVVIFGLGMVARDGLWLLAGIAPIGAAIWLAAAVIF